MPDAIGAAFHNISADGIRYFTITTWWKENATTHQKRGLVAITEEQVAGFLKRGQRTAYAQFFKIVIPGLVNTRHIFCGLKRDLRDGDDVNADEKKLVYSWAPPFDFEWQDGPVRKPADPRKVFVAIVTPNKSVEEFPDVNGWLEHWNWVWASRKFSQHPLDWRNRYTTKLWSRP